MILSVYKLGPRTLFDPGGIFTVNYYLVEITNILFFTNFVKKFTFVWTEGEGDKRCLNLNQVANSLALL